MKKICTVCGTEKLFSEFRKRPIASDGLRSSCQACETESQRIRRASNPEKSKAYAAAWYAANAENLRIKSCAVYAANPDKFKDLASAWIKANPEARRRYKNNRRARKIEAGGRLSKGLAEKLFKLQRGKCPCCGKPLGDDFHLDHKMPLALGGSNTDDNMQLLRQQCNNQKHVKHPVDFMQSRGFLL